MKFTLLLMLTSSLFCGCFGGGGEGPDTESKAQFTGRQFQVSLLTKEFYQRPEAHGFQSIKHISGSHLSIEKHIFLDKSDIKTARGLIHDQRPNTFGLKLEMTSAGINKYLKMLKDHGGREVAIILDGFVVAKFEVDKANARKILQKNKLNVLAEFDLKEVKTIIKGLNNK
jgi:hypothetical protein